MPISDCEVRDPRIRRTRQLLQGALGALMQQKSFDEVSVQDITDAATVNRATFYDHYNDKFQLLDAMVAGGFHELLHQRNVQFDGTCAYAASALVLATCDYFAQVHSKGGCQRQSAFEPLLDSAITVAIQRVLLPGLARHRVEAGTQPEMIAAAASWAICGAVKNWLANPGRRSAEQVVPAILELILPMLQSVMPDDTAAELKHSESPAGDPFVA